MGRPPAHIEVDAVTLGDHPYILIAPPDHRLAGDPDILAEDLLRERFPRPRGRVPARAS